MAIATCEFEAPPLHQNKHIKQNPSAEIAQLVEHNLAKVGVASSSLVFRSKAHEGTIFRFLLFLFSISPPCLIAYGHLNPQNYTSTSSS